MANVKKFDVEIEWLDNRFLAEVECDIYNYDSVVVTAITLTDIYQPFNKINTHGNPWVTVTPTFTFAAEYLPDSVLQSVEEQVNANVLGDGPDVDLYDDNYDASFL
mgnify:CR=1 FL=1